MSVWDFEYYYDSTLRDLDYKYSDDELPPKEKRKLAYETAKKMSFMSDIDKINNLLSQNSMQTTPEVPIIQDPIERARLLLSHGQAMREKAERGGTFTNEDLIPYMQAGWQSRPSNIDLTTPEGRGEIFRKVTEINPSLLNYVQSYLGQATPKYEDITLYDEAGRPYIAKRRIDKPFVPPEGYRFEKPEYVEETVYDEYGNPKIITRPKGKPFIPPEGYSLEKPEYKELYNEFIDDISKVRQDYLDKWMMADEETRKMLDQLYKYQIDTIKEQYRAKGLKGLDEEKPIEQTKKKIDQSDISQEDLEYTAKKYGITIEEVKRMLGIK